jgi:hypothetical protein
MPKIQTVSAHLFELPQGNEADACGQPNPPQSANARGWLNGELGSEE